LRLVNCEDLICNRHMIIAYILLYLTIEIRT